MITGRTIALSAAIAAGATGFAMADEYAKVIRGGDSVAEVRVEEHRLHRGEAKRLTKVVLVHVEDRIITQAKARAMVRPDPKDQPILIEHVNVRDILDPRADYIRQNWYKVDENSYLPAAHRLYLNLTAAPASIVWGSPKMMDQQAVEARPLFIIEKPGVPGAEPKLDDNAAPRTPAPKLKLEELMVRTK